MPGPQKVDWTVLEREAVTEGISDREIARRHALSNATVSSYARKNDWAGKKLAYRNAVSRRSYEKVAESVANETADITKENVLAARMYVRKFIADLNSGTIKPNAKDAIEFIKLLVTELMAPPEEKTDSVTIVESQPDGDVLRRLLDTARQRGAIPGPVDSGLLVDSPTPRQN